jgi:uncharacterized OB-fold protein
MNAIEKEAGLWTQIRTLKKRIDSLDMGKVDPVELKSAIDSLKDLESRYADQQEKKKQRKLEKETREKEMAQQKESAPAPEVPAPTPAVADPNFPDMNIAPHKAEDICGCGHSLPEHDFAGGSKLCNVCTDSHIFTPKAPQEAPVEKQSEVTTEAVSKNQDVVNAFLERSNPKVRSQHLYIEQVSPDIWNLVNYNTVIATIEGDDVKLNNRYYSQTTRVIQNKIWHTSYQMGLNVIDASTGEPMEFGSKPKKQTPVEEVEPVEKAADVSKFALDDIVEPVYGTSGSYGRVMRYDTDKDLAYIHWDSGKLKDDHGFGAYKGSDLRKRASRVRFQKSASMETESEVWQLESPGEEYAAQILSNIAQRAIDGDKDEQAYLRSIWDGEPWEKIEKKLQTEGSVWYVWWMDGVHNFMMQMSEEDEDVSKKAEGDAMDTLCESCGEVLGPEVFLSNHPVCGKCVRKRHKEVVDPSSKKSDQDGNSEYADMWATPDGRSVNSDSPPGWKKTVEKMKKHKDVNNPFALGWWMKEQGYRPKKSSLESDGTPDATDIVETYINGNISYARDLILQHPDLFPEAMNLMREQDPKGAQRFVDLVYPYRKQAALSKTATSWSVLPNGDLEIKMSRDIIQPGKTTYQNISEEDLDTDKAMYEFFEPVIGNGLSWVAPEDIGALTSAPILSDGAPDDQGNPDPNANYWWYPNYQIESPARELFEQGRVVFKKASQATAIDKEAAGCNQCDAAVINGVFCHETGCPNARKEREQEQMEDMDMDAANEKLVDPEFIKDVKRNDPMMNKPFGYPHPKEKKVAVGNPGEGQVMELNIANRKWTAKRTSGAGSPDAWVIFDDQGQQIMAITMSERELSKPELEQIVFNELGKKDLVRATLNVDLSIMKKGHKVKIVAVDLQRNEVKFASLESKSLSGWTKMGKFDITIAAEEREPKMGRHCKQCGSKIPLSFEEGALCRECERKKEHKSSLLMPLSKNTKVVRIKSSKTLTDLAQNCPDCFRKFLKFAKEKGVTVVADDASFTVEELERHVQDMRTKMDTTKENLQTQSVETKAMKPMPTEPIDDPNYEWVYIQEKDEWAKQRKKGT